MKQFRAQLGSLYVLISKIRSRRAHFAKLPIFVAAPWTCFRYRVIFAVRAIAQSLFHAGVRRSVIFRRF